MSAKRRRARAWLTYWQKIRRRHDRGFQRRPSRNVWDMPAMPSMMGPRWHVELAKMRVLEREVDRALCALQSHLGGWPILSMTTAEARARWPDANEKAPGQ